MANKIVELYLLYLICKQNSQFTLFPLKTITNGNNYDCLLQSQSCVFKDVDTVHIIGVVQ